MLHYILQTLIFQIVFLALYDAFHKKTTFFNWNRFYLLVTPILSLLLPFIKVDFFKTEASQIYVTKLERIITISSENLTQIGTTGPTENPINWWLIIYCIGLSISTLSLIFKLYKLKVITSFSFKSDFKNKKIVVLPNSNQAFSFWNTIYLGDQIQKNEKEQILIHEMVHVQQKHSLDQILFEILKTVLWWNPMMYIYQSRVTILHEYIADDAVTANVNKRSYIEQLLNTAFQTQEISFINQFFNQSLIKKRIVMLQKSKSKSIEKFKYLLLIPVIIGILVYTSCSEETNTSNSSIEPKEKTQNPENPDGVSFISNAPNCPNINAVYNRNLNNYLQVRSGKNWEVLIDLISLENSKKIRTAHLGINQTFFIRNIPEGKYKITATYGDNYAERSENGECIGYFKNQKAIEEGEQILDFNVKQTEKGEDIPSYNLKVELRNPATASQENPNNNNDPFAVNDIPYPDPNFEPLCPNKNAKYDKKLDNYLRLTSGKKAEVIATIISVENSQTIRTIHLPKDHQYFIRNIPEGLYKTHFIYGEDYNEKTVDGTCVGYFKNEKRREVGEHILDFKTIKTERGLNVPSYNLTVRLSDEE